MGMPATPSIPTEQAWQMVLGQLQMEMSKSNFDTWVKSIEFVSLEDGEFKLGTFNAYGRDWLDSRLKTTVQRLLQGILGQPVTVHFVVLDEVFDEEENEEIQDHDGEKEAFYLQVLHESVRGALVEPERVVKLPVYFLRWLPSEVSRTGMGFLTPSEAIAKYGDSSYDLPLSAFPSTWAGSGGMEFFLGNSAQQAVFQLMLHCYNTARLTGKPELEDLALWLLQSDNLHLIQWYGRGGSEAEVSAYFTPDEWWELGPGGIISEQQQVYRNFLSALDPYL
jgi:hypothetical protein